MRSQIECEQKGLAEELSTKIKARSGDAQRDKEIEHRDALIPARSPLCSSSYLIDADREFTDESMLTRKSL